MRRLQPVLVLLLLASGARAADTPSDGVDFFEKRIRPLLAEHCYKCHSAQAEKLKANFLLDSRQGLLKGGESGKPAVTPGEPDKSPLIEAVRYKNDDLKMPPKARLSDAQIADLETWVRLGAPFPAGVVASATTTESPPAPFDYSKGHSYWAFQPPKPQAIPEVQKTDWCRTDIDRFILAKLESNHLAPAPPADKRTLIRRATFDLHGLPPTPEEVSAFLNDSSPDAFAKVIDRLLASPRYGQRWARHWLDLVRYTDSFDSRGLGGAGDCADAWRYRDWVVNSLNKDLPYDQFLTHQLAGDLLPGAYDADRVIATTVLAIGNWGNGDSDKRKQLTDIVDDQVDLVGRAFLGVTLACARCHDHKFDPIPTADYYSLAGIFFSSHINPKPGPPTDGSQILRIPLISPQQQDRRKQDEAHLADIRKQIDRLADEQITALARSLLPDTDKYLLAAWEYAQDKSQSRPATEQFAASRHLHPHALRQWLAYLGAGDLKLLDQPLANVLDKPGLHSWNIGGDGTPNLTVNSTSQTVSFLTITLPPRSVAVHPSPKGGVGVGWRSPIAGKVRIAGRVADADDKCGDGIAWALKLRAASGIRELASGAFANGGAQSYSDGKRSADLADITIQQGDLLEVVILPKGDHGCDMTIVELQITELDGQKRTWDLTADLTPDPLGSGHGNPHADQHGNARVWHFYDLTGQPPAAALPPDSAMARFIKAATANEPNRAELQRLATEVQTALASAPSNILSPNSALRDDYLSPRGRFWSPARLDPANFSDSARPSLASFKSEESTLTQSLAKPIATSHGIIDGGCPETEHAGVPHDVRIHLRGRYDKLGELVPRNIPRFLSPDDKPVTIPSTSSGRLELAQWIASPTNPQTARVMANRIWQGHFGQGLVRTPNNFGKLGTPPTHPELLDWLALKFVESGWSIKAMHRAIMLSAVYQQSAAGSAEALRTDPENLLLARFPRQRLDAEALRDSLLAVAGQLDDTVGGPAVKELSSPRRTLYLITIRSDRSNYRTLFDAADPNSIIDKRIDSTVAPQALFLLNHPLLLEQSLALAKLALKQEDDAKRTEWLYRRLFARPASAREAQIGLALVQQSKDAGKSAEEAWDAYCQVLLCSNEFVYVD